MVLNFIVVKTRKKDKINLRILFIFVFLCFHLVRKCKY